jgi:hypothetical protein
MKNNKIKILSVIVLLLFAGLFAMPLFTHISCDMDCCNVPVNTCDMDMAGDNCCETMTECTLVPFQPVASAPLNIVDLQKDLTVDYNVSFSENFNIFEEYTLLQVIDKLCSSQVHPGFQTPLLV